MPKNWAVVFVSSSLTLAAALAAGTGCSGSSGNGDLNGDGGSILGGGLGGGFGGNSGGDATKTDAGAATTPGTATGSSSSSSGGASADVCKMQTANPACGQCIEASCCAQMKACAGDASCVALDGCFTACGPEDETCLRACTQKHPNGVTPWKAMYDCAQAQCATSCQ